ncbi:CsgG/HfaB family protein, partial [Elusimicrobiota bacterium]
RRGSAYYTQNMRMLLPFGLAASLTLIAGCAGGRLSHRPDYDYGKISHVGVLSFADAHDMPGTGMIVSDRIAQHLIGSGLSIIERGQLDKVLKEQRLGATGALSRDSVKELGRVLGVDAVVIGSLAAQTKGSLRATRSKKRPDILLAYADRRSPARLLLRNAQEPDDLHIYESVDVSLMVTVKMVLVETGEVLWIVSGTGEKNGFQRALESAIGPSMKRTCKMIRRSSRSRKR